jgi:predicted GIY-YIG superfamily endonuclease
MSWVVYLLRCGDDSLYTGCTNQLAQRLVKHQGGNGGRYTRSHLPVVLVYQESVADQSTALKREAAIKRLSRAEKIALIQPQSILLNAHYASFSHTITRTL